jgi:23S rRNA (cytosine1962-C5)-methyltransferase
MMKLYTPRPWEDYELLDSGEGEKLERFGKYLLCRPEPKAIWSKAMGKNEWEKAHARFNQVSSNSGKWHRKPEMPDNWMVQYRYQGMKLKFRLALTRFKHVGIFPEQAVNWDYLYDSLQDQPGARVLNLFAYTGGASLAARAAGADVTHCDSIKNVVNWANDNMQASQLSDIRWLIEDAFKFVRREARRGRSYQGIILDPPTYGHGPKGEKWKLEDMINELIAGVAQILDRKNGLLLFNSYSLGFSSLILYDLIHTHFGPEVLKNAEFGELYLPEASGRKLPAGIFLRFKV